MKLDEKKREIQLEAASAWKESDHIGTVELITGMGKTFVALDAMSKEKKGAKVLFLAETTQREVDLKKDIENYQKVFNIDILTHIDLTFACYQSACKWERTKWDLVVSDEIHDSLTPVYSQFYFRNKFSKLLGLSATVKSSQTYNIEGEEISKEVLLDSIAPVCYTYDVGSGQKDDTARKLNLYLIYHRLDPTTKSVKGGTKKKPFMTTEQRQYNYLNEAFSKAIYSRKDFLVRIAAANRARFLYSLPSKVEVVKKLLKATKGKSIIFGNDLATVEKVTKNVVRAARKGESKPERDKINLKLRSDFDLGRIRTIGSFKMLKQGANLKRADNVFKMSYYSTLTDFIQRIGRLRKNGNKRGRVFILITLGTQEEKWFDKMVQDVPLEEFTVHTCRNVDECIKMLKE